MTAADSFFVSLDDRAALNRPMTAMLNRLRVNFECVIVVVPDNEVVSC